MRNSERLYTTLIFRASRKYGSWDPEIPVEVGDYGVITAGGKKRTWHSVWMKRKPKQQGIFLKEGNVYKDGFADKHGLPLPQEYGDGDVQGVTWVTSKNAKEVDVDVAATGQTPVLVECKIKAAFQFSSKKGAVLVMQNDSIASIQPPAKIRFLYDEPSLHNKVIVSEVHNCSSYARFVSTSRSSSVALGLSVTSPDGTQGLVGDISSGAEARWVKNASAGNFKTRTRMDGKRVYYPLFRLVSLDDKGLTTGLRGSAGEGGGDPPLPDVVPPWLKDGGEKTEDENLDDSASDCSDLGNAEMDVLKRSPLPFFRSRR